MGSLSCFYKPVKLILFEYRFSQCTKFQSSFTEYNDVYAHNILIYSCLIIAFLELDFCIEINNLYKYK